MNARLKLKGLLIFTKLRLSIKRMRTLLSLLEFVSNGEISKGQHLAILSPIFKQAGLVREIQLNLKLISGRRLVYIHPYRYFLNEQKKRAIRKLITELKGFDHEKFKELNVALFERLKSLSEEQISNQIYAFRLKRLSKVMELLEAVHDDDVLHKIRTQIKRTGDILSLTRKSKMSEGLKSLRKTIKTLDNNIGSWHDNKVLIDSIEHFNEQNENRKVRSYLTRVISQFEKRNDTSRNNIEKLLGDRFLRQGLKVRNL